MCFTEVKISKKNHNFYHHKDYNTYHNLPDNHQEQAPKEGLIILIRKTLCYNHPTITHTHPGKATIILFKFPNLTLKCYCLYAPSQNDTTSLAFYEDLFDSHPPDPTQNTIYIGDFNVVQNTTLDRRNHNIKYHKPKTHKYLTASMLDHALVDPWRTQYPDRIQYSWDNKSSASRIDFALVSDNLYHQVTDTSYSTAPVDTDHKSVTLTINFNKFKSGKGYPKVKNTLYTDPSFVAKINTMIAETLPAHPESSAENVLDLILFNTSTIATQHLKEAKDTHHANINYLTTEIKTIEAQLDSILFERPMTKAQTNYNNKLHNKLTDLNQQLKDEHLELFNQTYMAELERDLLNPHKPAKDFKKPQTKHNNPLSEMYVDNNDPPTLSKDQTTVHNHIFSFYKSLFSHKPCNDKFSDLQQFMDGIDLDKITQEENTALERPITKLEIANFIKSMSNDKAPGITGITPAFYKCFGLRSATS